MNLLYMQVKFSLKKRKTKLDYHYCTFRALHSYNTNRSLYLLLNLPTDFNTNQQFQQSLTIHSFLELFAVEVSIQLFL